MNRITNKYGARESKTPEGIALSYLEENFERDVTEFINMHELTPEEIQSLEHHLLYSLTTVCAEKILFTAMKMRKAEQLTKT